MITTLPVSTFDLAGESYSHPHYFQIQNRVRSLINCYLTIENLDDRIQDLPVQFSQPQCRPWKAIDWQRIAPDQIIGIEQGVFLEILQGAIDTEAPIRGYTQTSRQYLARLHPPMARFVGGIVAEDGTLLELGLWEKEERRHTPALMKIYTRLTDRKITPSPHIARNYQPSVDAYNDLYRHGLHRVATEYGATCLYLWLMAHSTGELQAVLEELVLDEINHMTKFWGFGVWAYPDTSLLRIGKTLVQTMPERLKYSSDRGSLIGTLQRMRATLNWQSWSWTNRATFAYTCTLALYHIWNWSRRLTPDNLQALFGEPLQPTRE